MPTNEDLDSTHTIYDFTPTITAYTCIGSSYDGPGKFVKISR